MSAHSGRSDTIERDSTASSRNQSDTLEPERAARPRRALREAFDRIHSSNLQTIEEAFRSYYHAPYADESLLPAERLVRRACVNALSQLTSEDFVTWTIIPARASRVVQGVPVLASILGPVQTPYEDGIFHLFVLLPPSWYVKPPVVRFMTPVYHPNVDSEGDIDLNILCEHGWSPALGSVGNVLHHVAGWLSVLEAQEEPFAPEIAAVLERDRAVFEVEASEWTAAHASGELPSSEDIEDVIEQVTEDIEAAARRGGRSTRDQVDQAGSS